MTKPKFFSWRRAASAQQYALLLGLIGVIALSVIIQLGRNVSLIMAKTSNTLTLVSNGSIAGAAPTLSNYLVVTDPTLATNLNTRIGAASGWTQCYVQPYNTAFDVYAFVAGCQNANKLLQITDVGNGVFFGGYLNDTWNNYFGISWTFHPGFFFTSANGRGSKAYDSTCAENANGNVEVTSSYGNNFLWINAYHNAATLNFFDINGDWGTGGCTPFNPATGTNGPVNIPATLYFYKK